MRTHADLKQAEADMKQAVSGLKQAEAAMKQAVSGLKQAEAAMKQAVSGLKQAEAAMKQAVSGLKQAEGDHTDLVDRDTDGIDEADLHGWQLVLLISVHHVHRFDLQLFFLYVSLFKEFPGDQLGNLLQKVNWWFKREDISKWIQVVPQW